MGCGISRFGRNNPEQGDELSTGSQSKPQPQPEGGNPVDGAKDKEISTSTSPSPSTAPAPTQSAGLEKEEIGRIKVNQPEGKEDVDDDDNKQGHEMADDSIFRYPRFPSFREYCTDPEIRFDSGPDSDGEYIYIYIS